MGSERRSKGGMGIEGGREKGREKGWLGRYEDCRVDSQK